MVPDIFHRDFTVVIIACATTLTACSLERNGRTLLTRCGSLLIVDRVVPSLARVATTQTESALVIAASHNQKLHRESLVAAPAGNLQ
jgi:hypothetical protein